jgi:ribosomal-protein-alanine N-acetyltransferase
MARLTLMVSMPDWFADACKLHRESALKDDCYNWVVFHKQTHQHLGKIDLSTIQRDVFQWANLGYVIHNQFWRQGFGKEAVTVVVKAGFEKLHYHRIEAAINLDNHASIALVESVGLQRECIRRAYWYENEQWVDHLIYVALPGDFAFIRKATVCLCRELRMPNQSRHSDVLQWVNADDQNL